jgi:hypothetical protein
MTDQVYPLAPLQEELAGLIARATGRVFWAFSNTTMPERQHVSGDDPGCCLTADGTREDFQQVKGALDKVPVGVPEEFLSVLAQLEASTAPVSHELVRRVLREVVEVLWSFEVDALVGEAREADKSGHAPPPPSLTLIEVYRLAMSALEKLSTTGRRSAMPLSDARPLFAALASARKFVSLPEPYARAAKSISLAVANRDSHVRAVPIRQGLQVLIPALVGAMKENQR